MTSFPLQLSSYVDFAFEDNIWQFLFRNQRKTMHLGSFYVLKQPMIARFGSKVKKYHHLEYWIVMGYSLWNKEYCDIANILSLFIGHVTCMHDSWKSKIHGLDKRQLRWSAVAFEDYSSSILWPPRFMERCIHMAFQ